MKLTKKHLLFKMALALALAAVLCLGSLATALAAGDPIQGSAATIRKDLLMPEGTTTPTVDFKFTFEKVSLSNLDDDDSKADMPEITEKAISFAEANTGSTANGLKTVTIESTNIFAGITWPYAGVYTYTLTETADTYTIVDPDLETMDYSGAKYTVTAYVENGQNGPELKYISAVIEEKDGSHEGTAEAGDKVDPTPGSSKMAFTNTYTKISGGGTIEESSLAISKTVAGSMGNTTTQYFPFTIKTTAAATQNGTVTYKAYLMEGNTVIAPAAQNGTFTTGSDAAGTYIIVTAGTDLSINMKHNQKLVFTDLPVGAKYEAGEGATANYAPSIALLVNNGAGDVPNSDVNVPLSTEELLIGEGTNSAAFTNTFDTSITPTGISLNDLPFILMIVLAVGALVVFVIVKARRKAAAQSR